MNDLKPNICGLQSGGKSFVGKEASDLNTTAVIATLSDGAKGIKRVVFQHAEIWKSSSTMKWYLHNNQKLNRLQMAYSICNWIHLYSRHLQSVFPKKKPIFFLHYFLKNHWEMEKQQVNPCVIQTTVHSFILCNSSFTKGLFLPLKHYHIYESAKMKQSWSLIVQRTFLIIKARRNQSHDGKKEEVKILHHLFYVCVAAV